MTAKRALIVGCGYTGERLAGRLRELGLAVLGTTRSAARAADLEAAGIEPLIGGLGDPETLERIAELGPELVAYFVPPQAKDDPLPAVLAAAARAPLEAFLYASSTAVYGDRGGDWVDETTTPRPETPEARARLAAELVVLEAGARREMPTRICRITGIYGPGRTLKGALAGGDYVLIKDHDTWVSRIHVDDLVSGLIAAWQRGADGRVYNLVDDEPHRSSEFANLAVDLQGLPRPRWVEKAEAIGRYGEERLYRKLASKRVRSVRLKEELKVELRFPTYREGLPAAIAERRSR